MTKVVSWNMRYKREPWQELARMGADVALLQETCNVPSDLAGDIETWPRTHKSRDSWDSSSLDSCLWESDLYKEYFKRRRWPRIAKLSDRVEVQWFRPVLTVTDPIPGDAIRVSDVNSIAAAKVTPVNGDQKPFVVISMYAGWIPPHPSTGGGWNDAMPDVSAHRIISDLSAFIRKTEGPHQILAAGDLNLDYGGWETDTSHPHLYERARTVWDRMTAIGFEYLGPRHPNGRRAHPTPSHLPASTRNVPTFYSNRSTPRDAQLQLDHVFASEGFHETIKVRAMNHVQEWGSSDHCRLWIEVQE